MNADEYIRQQNAQPVPEIVYHSSPQSGLTKLQPRKGTHGQPWVYATDDIAISAMFLGRDGGGDLGCSSGISNGEVYIYERWDGAFDARYKDKKGSIYELPGKTFQRGRTSFTGDLISEVAVTVLSEARVEDARAILLDLQEAGKLRIFMVQQRPDWIPEDDQDLVERVVQWSGGDPNSNSYRYAQKHHPHLMGRIIEALKHSHP